MAETLLQVVADICRPVGLDPTITEFKESDGTNDIVQYVYEAYRALRRRVVTNSEYFFKTATFNTVTSTRTYTLATDAEPHDLYQWSLKDTTNNTEIKAASREFIKKRYPNYKTDEGKPQYFYYEGGDTLALYPVPDAVYEMEYEYGQQVSEDTSTTATFLVPDDWLDYVKKHAQYLYEKAKGFGDEQATYMELRGLLSSIIVQASRSRGGSRLRAGKLI